MFQVHLLFHDGQPVAYKAGTNVPSLHIYYYVRLRCLPLNKRYAIILVLLKENIMLSENIKVLRKAKGYSQDDVAEKLHVTRQTISKWERNLSVPDADLLVKLAECFDVNVKDLLGDEIEVSKDTMLDKLEQLNDILAERNRRNKKIWNIIKYVLMTLLVFVIIGMMVSILSGSIYQKVETTIEQVDEISEE